MPGKCTRALIPGFTVGSDVITPQADIVITTASSFSMVCRYDNYDPRFRVFKDSAKIFPLNFAPRVTEANNNTFSMDEFLTPLERCRNTSPGPDGIQNEMLSHLPPTGKEFILCIHNSVWTEISVPEAWRGATVTPIPKLGGEHSLATSYRPISLTSCLCKTMERMVNRRFVWILESRCRLSNAQCGFRRHRPSLDNVVNLEYHI
jgi:potassium voltage-gated channel Eag-related subfamily H protein 8